MQVTDATQLHLDALKAQMQMKTIKDVTPATKKLKGKK